MLRDLDISVLGRELRVVTGASGSGKSTLLNVLSGLDFFDSGRLFIVGERITGVGGKTIKNLRRNVTGFIFQGYNLIEDRTALENVMLPLFYKGVGYFERRNAALSSLEKMGLREKVYSLPKQLSGRQQQRVAVARALVTKPKVLFCDEPTGNLDRESARLVLDGIMRLKKTGSRVVMITHDLSLPKSADSAYLLKEGKLERM